MKKILFFVAVSIISCTNAQKNEEVTARSEVEAESSEAFSVLLEKAKNDIIIKDVAFYIEKAAIEKYMNTTGYQKADQTIIEAEKNAQATCYNVIMKILTPNKEIGYAPKQEDADMIYSRMPHHFRGELCFQKQNRYMWDIDWRNLCKDILPILTGKHIE